MKPTNLFAAPAGFQVLETTQRSQTAAMILKAGESSSDEANRHPHSDQVLLVVEGEVTAEIAGQRWIMRPGDSVIVRANTPHKFSNRGEKRAITFSTYAPPAYPPETKD